MNEKELLLITNLRKNSRATLTKMSKTTNIPISTLYDMLKKTDKIKRHTCIPDFSSLGFGMRAMFLVSIVPDHKEKLKNYLQQHPNLNGLFKINNGFDFLFEMIYKSMGELEQFNEYLEQHFMLKEKHVHYIIEDITREQFLSDSLHNNLFKLAE